MGLTFLTQTDGAQHARLRRLLIPAFSAHRMEQIESSITAIVEGMLDDVERAGPQFDGMTQYGAKLVIGALVSTMMGLNEAQQQVLIDYQEVLPLATARQPGEPYPAEYESVARRTAELVEYTIAERRAGRRADFLNDLVQARDRGDKLSDEELFGMIYGLFGSIAATSRSAGGALYTLYSHTDQLAQLIADPALIPDAVEECLRVASNGYFTFARIATRDTEVGGTPIYEGMIVRPSPLAANYDPLVYPDPQRFDIHRKPKRIMSFAVGPHFCVGNILGRTTITIAMERLLARFPKARLVDPDFVPVYGGAVGELRLLNLPMLIQ
jgi:cytochrome P450